MGRFRQEIIGDWWCRTFHQSVWKWVDDEDWRLATCPRCKREWCIEP